MKLHVEFSDISEDIDVELRDNSRDIPVKFENLQRVTEYIGGDVYWDDILDKPFETLEDVKEAVLKDIPDVPTKLSELDNDAGFITAKDVPKGVTSWNDLEDKPVFAEVATSGSWNDLTDKPFGEGETSWNLVASGELCLGSSVHDVTMNFTAVVGRNYKLEFYGIEDKENSIVAIVTAPCTAYEIMPGYTIYQIGEIAKGVYGQSNNTNKQWTFHSVKTGTAGLKINVYEEVEAVTTLDEKYIPETIARKTDIPDIPMKLSEFENDAGFITRSDIPPIPSTEEIVEEVLEQIPEQPGGGGVTSWNDLTDKPFREEPEFDIQWNGDMTDRVALDMSMLGYPQGLYYVKVSNDVFTTEELIGCRYTETAYVGDNFEGEIYPDMVDTKTYPGAIAISYCIVVVHDDNALATALGIPTGIYTNGVYFYLRTGNRYTSNLVSANTITKVDNKHLDMDSIITDVLNALPIYNGEVVAE